MTQEIPPGRVQTLSVDEEFRLKQVWAHLFNFWRVPVKSSKVLSVGKEQKTLDRTNTTTSTASAETAKPKKKKLLGKFLKSSNPSPPPPAPVHKRTSSVTSTRSSESIEAAYPHTLIHDSLKDLEADEIRNNFWQMLRADYPDNLILRFLRARKWDTDKAMGMIAHTLHWRLKESKVDDIIRGGERAAYTNNETGFVKNIELSKAVVRGFDKKGHPIVLVRPKLHHSSDQSEDEMKKYCLLVIEEARLFLKEPVDAATILFDLTGFSMSNMDYAPVKYLISCFEAHYPECLGKLFIHKAPWIFPPIWNIIKNWLDPVVASKVVFTKSAKDLAEYIPMEHIPVYLGGDDDHDLDRVIKLDGSHDKSLSDSDNKDSILEERDAIIQKFIDATVKWIESESPEDSKKFLDIKISIGKQLSENYCKLDPYIRSRCIYDIDGTLKV